jgi:hypothetical protein
MAVVLATSDDGDGFHTVTVGTDTYGQAHVVVPAGAIDHPDIDALYTHVQNISRTAWTARRQSRRDEKRLGA